MYSKDFKRIPNGDADSQEALLSDDDLTHMQPYKHISLKQMLIIHGGVLGFYTILFVITWRASITTSCPSHQFGVDTYDPAVKELEYIRVTADINNPNPYKGSPSQEVDSAWDELLRGYNIRIPSKTLHKMNRNSVLLADDSGDYWGILSSYHNLHCLRQIRQHLAPEYYAETGYSHTASVYPPHIEHCIESLRQFVMCHADATMLTWYWPAEKPQPGEKYFPKTNYTFHEQCVNWPKLQEWAIQNSFELSPETISHPDYGYPW